MAIELGRVDGRDRVRTGHPAEEEGRADEGTEHGTCCISRSFELESCTFILPSEMCFCRKAAPSLWSAHIKSGKRTERRVQSSTEESEKATQTEVQQAHISVITTIT